jgi:hypothetical protein
VKLHQHTVVDHEIRLPSVQPREQQPKLPDVRSRIDAASPAQLLRCEDSTRPGFLTGEVRRHGSWMTQPWVDDDRHIACREKHVRVGEVAVNQA